MITWLLRFLGYGSEVASNFSHAELRWAHGELAAIGLALLIPVSWLVIRRQRQNLAHVSPRARNALNACRIGVLLLLVLVLGAPYLHTDETLDLKLIVALIVDDSASMDLPAGPFDQSEVSSWEKLVDLPKPSPPSPTPGGTQPSADDDAAASLKRLNEMTRAELLNAGLRKARHGIIEPLAEKFELKFYRASQQIRPTTLDELLDPPGKAQSVPADKNETDLGDAITRAVDDAQGRKIAGLVLLTDGHSTTGPDPVTLARNLVEHSPDVSPAPVFSVPVGSEHPTPDLAVVEVAAAPLVAKDDTVSVEVTLASSGLAGQTASVELHDGDGPALATEQIKLSGARRQTAVLTYHADQPGTHLLRATAAALPGETVVANNSAATTVRVSSEPTKLLYLEGFARWDFRFLDHSLRRDKAMSTTFTVESQLEADGVPADQMPKAAGLPTDRAGWAQYHVVMLGDISPAILPLDEQQALVEAIEEDGLGLVVQCGTRHMPWDFAGQPLGEILPMHFDPLTSGTAALPTSTAGSHGVLHGQSAPAFAPFRMIVTPAGAAHPAFATSGNPTQDRATWSRMPEFFWAAAGSKLKPGATRLADVVMTGGKERLPILAEQFVGRGRVLVVGCDETFRWRRNVGDRVFYRFWGQALRHVARKPAPGGQESWIEVEPKRVEPGRPVTIDVYAVDDAHEPLETPDVSVLINEPAGPLTIRLEHSGEPGHFRGNWTPEELGVQRVELATGKEPRPTANVEVANSGRELIDLDVDREMLGTLADVSGGQMLELTQLADLPPRLAGQVSHLEKPYEQDLWDNWLVLLALAALFCTDIGIRRMFGLL